MKDGCGCAGMYCPAAKKIQKKSNVFSKVQVEKEGKMIISKLKYLQLLKKKRKGRAQGFNHILAFLGRLVLCVVRKTTKEEAVGILGLIVCYRFFLVCCLCAVVVK